MDLVELMALKMADGADKCIGPIYIYIYRDRVDWPMDWEIDANKNHNCSIALCCFNVSKIHDLSHPFTPKKIVDGANS